MANQIKNIVQFAAVAPAGVIALPHGINIAGRGLVPDEVKRSNTDFVIVSVDTVDVTVRNDGAAAADCDVLVEWWHTLEREFGDTAVVNLTPKPFIGGSGGTGGGGVAAATFVFQPGGTAVANVYTDWLLLVADLPSVLGPKDIVIDSSFVSPAVIPAGGPYDLTDCTLRGKLFDSTALDIADGASFTGLRTFKGNMTVTNLNTVTSPVTDMGVGESITVEDAMVNSGVGAVPFFQTSPFNIVSFYEGGGMGLSGDPVINIADGATLIVVMHSGGLQRDSVSGGATATLSTIISARGSILAEQPNFAGTFAVAVSASSPQATVRGQLAQGFADALVATAPAGSVVPGLAANTYDVDVTFDVGGLQQLAVVVAGGEDYDALAALLNTPATNGTIVFLAGAFRCISDTFGTASTALVAAGTAGSGGGDLFAAITAATGNAVSFPAPTAGTGPLTALIADLFPGEIAYFDATGGAIAQVLPQVTAPTGFLSGGVKLRIMEVSGTAGLTIAPFAGDTINGVAAAIPVPGGGTFTLISDGVRDWRVLDDAGDRWGMTAVVIADPAPVAFGSIVRCNPTGGAFAVTIPAITGASRGQSIVVKNSSASLLVITVTPTGGDTIDGAATFPINIARASITLVSDGVGNWEII